MDLILGPVFFSFGELDSWWTWLPILVENWSICQVHWSRFWVLLFNVFSSKITKVVQRNSCCSSVPALNCQMTVQMTGSHLVSSKGDSSSWKYPCFVFSWCLFSISFHSHKKPQRIWSVLEHCQDRQ